MFENLPSEVFINDDKLLLKSTFHVSLVCINEIIKKHNVVIQNFKNLVLNDFCEFSNKNNIEILEYNDFKFAKENDLRSVIVMCKVSNLDKFFNILNKKYNLTIEYPPIHITLYTITKGIFLTDINDIKNLTKPILNPIGREL